MPEKESVGLGTFPTPPGAAVNSERNKQKLPKASHILRESWEIYKTKYKTLISLAAVLLISQIVILVLILGRSFNGLYISTNLINARGIPFTPTAILGTIILIVASIWTTVASLLVLIDNHDITWTQALKKSQFKIWPFFLASLLVGLAVLGGFILLLIPGIIFSFWFSQVPYIVVAEDLGGTSALKKSKYYVKGRIGSIFGKLFYMGLISVALLFALQVILFFINKATGISMDNLGWLNSIFYLFWTPMPLIFGYQLYTHLRQS